MEAAIKDRVSTWIASNSNNTSTPITDECEAMKNMLELVLDGVHLKNIDEKGSLLLSKFVKLKKLSLNQTSLKSLEKLPSMPTVTILEIADNHINGGLDIIPKNFPSLKKLEIGGNYIKSSDALIPLKQQSSLEQLGLDICPIADTADYREKVFSLLPQLKVLDCIDKEGKENGFSDEDDDEEYDETDNTLKDFYDKYYEDDDDDGDAEDFEPNDDEDDDDDDDEEDDDDETENSSSSTTTQPQQDNCATESTADVEMTES